MWVWKSIKWNAFIQGDGWHQIRQATRHAKGGDLTLGITTEICRNDKMAQLGMKLMSNDKEVATRKHGGSRKKSNKRGLNRTSNEDKVRMVEYQIKMADY